MVIKPLCPLNSITSSISSALKSTTPVGMIFLLSLSTHLKLCGRRETFNSAKDLLSTVHTLCLVCCLSVPWLIHSFGLVSHKASIFYGEERKNAFPMPYLMKCVWACVCLCVCVWWCNNRHLSRVKKHKPQQQHHHHHGTLKTETPWIVSVPSMGQSVSTGSLSKEHRPSDSRLLQRLLGRSSSVIIFFFTFSHIEHMFNISPSQEVE